PRPASFWQTEAANPVRLTAGQIDSIARRVDALSGFFDWPDATKAAAFTQVLNPTLPTDARSDAKREYAALLANVAAAQLQTNENGGGAIFLNTLTEVVCPGVDDSMIGELTRPVDP